MRLWTLHPQYLDARGLVALWREALLAQKVLRGKTRGYRNHPQLTRFRAMRDPLDAIATYLTHVLEEANRRGYAFDGKKIGRKKRHPAVREAKDQLLFEWTHLQKKLKRRDHKQYWAIRSVRAPLPHPLFRIVRGGVRDWERVK